VNRKYKEIEYPLDDGKLWTIKQIVAITALGKDTIYYRLKRSNNKEYVFSPPTRGSMRRPTCGIKTFVEKRAEEWIDKPVEVYYGIPMNPSYMDGLRDRDRDGNILSQNERASLMYYRENNRNVWIKKSTNIIKGRKQIGVGND
jgi:hypothetical protein